ncbi:pre-rRNA processing protein [Arthroderma uncinatum]|uniref:pre-rRNA processing protein n=1 Tax=Arthroderma uncinatum TaxID=74035 RepID=UPI00144ACBC1|nr:pre-rRNA processing protein [Arthroderma uncinatum]KAF3492397.1 pre-rRNA processing protein [Arthroderma uncinatum]
MEPVQQQQTPGTLEQSTPLSPSAQLDLAITLILHSWPSLTLAVESSWGGPTSSSKRDWFCGAIAELFTTRPETDAQDLEDVLIQVMTDEFDVVVDDGSVSLIADQICELKAEIEKGKFERVQAMWEQFKVNEQNGGSKLPSNIINRVGVNGNDSSDDDDEDDGDEDDDDDEDTDMADAPAPRSAPRQREEPEVDDDGFTKVVGRKKR